MTSMLQQWANVVEEADKLRYGQQSWKDWPVEKKKANCYHANGQSFWGIDLEGNLTRQPIYCNLCEDCFKRKTEAHKEKFETIAAEAKQKHPDGEWRMKIVSKGKEAGALKKRISRNQDKNHMELAISKDELAIWTFVTKDEPGKNLDKIYGNTGNPINDISWRESYNVNREIGSKVSFGSGLKKRAVSGDEKEEMVKVPQPKLIVAKAQEKTAKDILYRTALVKEAKTIEDVTKGIHTNFYKTIDNLKATNIEVLGIKETFISISPQKAIKKWNRNVKSWQMSKDASKSIDGEAKADFYNLLHYPKAKKTTNSVSKSDMETMKYAFEKLNWGK